MPSIIPLASRISKRLPPGITVKPAGDSEAFVELFLGFALAMGLTAAFSLFLLSRRLRLLEYETFMLQKMS